MGSEPLSFRACCQRAERVAAFIGGAGLFCWVMQVCWNLLSGAKPAGAESGLRRGTPRYLDIHVTDPAVSDVPAPQSVDFLHPGNACICANNACSASGVAICRLYFLLRS